ncbi:MAG: type II toxin-antitoxin system PemK/MazF family toxin [Firmicutes bacterium]|nr:type II toxin-antitoxin system PemK/MazF family toxin [Bacillota bacterium]
MNNMLSRLLSFLSSLLPTRQQKFVNGLNSNIDCWLQEDTFDYSSTVTYKYGDFIHYNLGCNVGSEQGGPRYGIVIEDSAQLSKTVLVIPVHGSEEYYSPAKYEAYINKPFTFLSKNHHYAVITQMRAISKIRIDRKFGKIDTCSILILKGVMKNIFKI